MPYSRVISMGLGLHSAQSAEKKDKNHLICLSKYYYNEAYRFVQLSSEEDTDK